MALRELLLKLGIDVDKGGVRNADAALGSLKKAAVAAGAAFVAFKAISAIKGVVDDVRAMGDEIDKTSRQIGIGAEALQELRFAGGLAGASSAEVSTSLKKLQKNAFEAARGTKTMVDDFAKLGINVKDANGNLKSGEQLINEVADGMQGLSNDTERAALAQTVMGRAGAKLVPLLVQGSEGINKMRLEARELGGVMDQELIDATAKLTDDQARLGQAWQGLKNGIAKEVIPIFLKVVNAMIKIAKVIRGPVIAAISVISNIVGGFIEAMEFLNEKFGGLGTVIGIVTTGLGALGAAMLLFGRKAVFAAIRVAAAWALANLPLVLMIGIIGLILLIIDDVVTFFRGGDSLIGRFIDKIRGWVKEVGGFTNFVSELFRKFLTKVLGFSDATATKITDVFEVVVETISDIISSVGKAIGLVQELLGLTDDNEGRVGAVSRQRELRRRRAFNAAAATRQTTQNQSNNTSINVSVDARGQTNPAAIANTVSNKISRAQSNRQSAQPFATAPR